MIFPPAVSKGIHSYADSGERNSRREGLAGVPARVAIVGMPGQINPFYDRPHRPDEGVGEGTGWPGSHGQRTHPGLICTEMTRSLPEAYRKKVLAQIPLQRRGVSSEVVRVAAFLLSAYADYITGQVIQAGGGPAVQKPSLNRGPSALGLLWVRASATTADRLALDALWNGCVRRRGAS